MEDTERVPSFGDRLRELRLARGLSLARLSRLTHYSKGYLSNVENGHKRPTHDLARLCDEALGTRDALVEAARADATARLDATPWQTAELVSRLRASDTTLGTLEALHATVDELCCQYPYRDADDLRREGQGWLGHVSRLLHRPVGLHEHTELLAAGGMLALLIGCLEYDLGLRASAESTRVAARQLGEEAGRAEVVGWTWEMASWFALTQNRFTETIVAAEAGQRADGGHSVHVQLIAQEAKARARLGDVSGASAALNRGRAALDRLDRPARLDHHFVVDPAKFDFYCMDVYRMAGQDDRAQEYAQVVVRDSTAQDGTERAPMRTTEARFTMAAVASRRGDLDTATSLGLRALDPARRSLPHVLLLGAELENELGRRYPHEQQTAEFRDALHAIGDGKLG